MDEKHHYGVVDNLDKLFLVLPEHILKALEEKENSDELIEIVMDLGRSPEARFTNGFCVLIESPVERSDIEYTLGRVGMLPVITEPGSKELSTEFHASGIGLGML